MLSRSAGLVVLAFGLTGCLWSDEPLIGAAESVTPIAPGTYGDDSEDPITVTHQGTITRIAEGEDEPDDLWIREFDRGYYIAMSQDRDDDYSYALMRVEDAGFTVYAPLDDCDRLRELWLRPGKTPEDVGIVSINQETDSSCELRRYEDLARAFRALIDAGAVGTAQFFARK